MEMETPPVTGAQGVGVASAWGLYERDHAGRCLDQGVPRSGVSGCVARVGVVSHAHMAACTRYELLGVDYRVLWCGMASPHPPPPALPSPDPPSKAGIRGVVDVSWGGDPTVVMHGDGDGDGMDARGVGGRGVGGPPG